MKIPAYVVFFFVFPLLGRPPARAAAPEESGNSRLFQEGVRRYAEGDAAGALALFREVVRREPGHGPALAAIRRLEVEGAPRPARRGPAPARAGALERFFLGTLPRWYHFDRSVGDGLRDVGTLIALNARIIQLMGERRVALDRGRPFPNERRLRELLRRAPLASRSGDES